MIDDEAGKLPSSACLMQVERIVLGLAMKLGMVYQMPVQAPDVRFNYASFRREIQYVLVNAGPYRIIRSGGRVL
eukprot:g50322.t1